jgi:hypothetical protein
MNGGCPGRTRTTLRARPASTGDEPVRHRFQVVDEVPLGDVVVAGQGLVQVGQLHAGPFLSAGMATSCSRAAA